MTDIPLRADCAQCAALCCIALAFDRSPLFATDKPAGKACAYLSARDRCSIHARRTEAGFAGCVQFDCLGAGQRVTAMFAGRSWRDGPETARAMFDAFAAMRRAHELILLLQEAERLPLADDQRATCRVLRQRVGARVRTIGLLAAFARSGLHAEVTAFLRDLRPAAALAMRFRTARRHPHAQKQGEE